MALDKVHLEMANVIMNELRSKLIAYAGNDPDLLLKMRRRIYNQLDYDERGNPSDRAKLKKEKFRLQNGKCALCNETMPMKGSHLHRIVANGNCHDYTVENTQLVHSDCHSQHHEANG